MASRKKPGAASRKRSAKPRATDSSIENIGTVLSTFSGPSTLGLDQATANSLDDASQQRLATQRVGAEAAAAAVPFNPLKAGEHGLKGGNAPKAGSGVEPHALIDTASTVTEGATSEKVGEGEP